MKTNKLYRNAAVAMAFLAVGAMTTACSDWDDHYDSNGITGSASETIWENVKANANLSQFAELIHKAGYDEVINTSQTYTVWAPLNGTFNYDSLKVLPVSNLKEYFAKNHVARFNFPATGSINEFVTMLNKKMMAFVGSGTYTLNGVEVVTPNVASSNGVLHVTNGMLGYKANLMESLDTLAYPIDSIARYFHKYDTKVLDEANSVKGPVVDGRLTYLDSVFIEHNQLVYLHNALLTREDSSYSMIVPTNTAWQKAYTEVKKLYHYAPFTYVKEVPANNLSKATDDENYDKSSRELDFDLLRDSITHYIIAKDLFYNNNVYHNKVLKSLQLGSSLQTDSLVSTAGDIFYGDDAKSLFEGATRIDKSNGSMWIPCACVHGFLGTQSLRFKVSMVPIRHITTVLLTVSPYPRQSRIRMCLALFLMVLTCRYLLLLLVLILRLSSICQGFALQAMRFMFALCLPTSTRTLT